MSARFVWSFEVKRVKHESLKMACVSLRPQSIVLDLWIYRGQPAAWKNWNAQGIHLDFCLWEHQETIQLVHRRTCVHLDVDQSLVYLAHTVLTFSPRSLLAKEPHTREFLPSNDFGSLNCLSFLCRFSCLPHFLLSQVLQGEIMPEQKDLSPSFIGNLFPKEHSCSHSTDINQSINLYSVPLRSQEF